MKKKIDVLTTENECLWYGERLIIPLKCQQRILELLHESHPGIVRMKCLARIRFWWRKMDDDVENFVKSCDVCNDHQNSNSNRNLCPWKASIRPFERIHLDFFHIFGTTFLILVDNFQNLFRCVQ